MGRCCVSVTLHTRRGFGAPCSQQMLLALQGQHHDSRLPRLMPKVDQPLALAGMHARADLQAERANATADGRGTADGPGRPVEGGKEAVARGVDLSPPIALQLVAGRNVEAVEQLVPAGIAELRGPLG